MRILLLVVAAEACVSENLRSTGGLLIQQTTAPTATACFTACSENSDCTVWNYGPASECELRGGAVVGVFDKDWLSGDVACEFGACERRDGVYYEGIEVSISAASSVAHCAKKCVEMQECRFYNWSTNLRCRLLSDRSFMVRDDAAKTGGVECFDGCLTLDVSGAEAECEVPQVEEHIVFYSEQGCPGGPYCEWPLAVRDGELILGATGLYWYRESHLHLPGHVAFKTTNCDRDQPHCGKYLSTEGDKVVLSDDLDVYWVPSVTVVDGAIREIIQKNSSTSDPFSGYYLAARGETLQLDSGLALDSSLVWEMRVVSTVNTTVAPTEAVDIGSEEIPPFLHGCLKATTRLIGLTFSSVEALSDFDCWEACRLSPRCA